MSSRSLPILMPPTPEQRYSCHSCTACCRDLTVQLRGDDLRRLDEQQWEKRLGFSPVVEFRGRHWLKQRDDGACVFLQDDGLCRIHAEFGRDAKPLACRMFPFVVTPGEGAVRVGLSYACPSVISNRGAELTTHAAEVRRMVELIPEFQRVAAAPLLKAGIKATAAEEQAVIRAFERLLGRVDLPMGERLDGAAWLTGMLRQAKLQAVRGDRLRDLLEILVDSFEDEIDAAPPAAPTARQMKMLRQIAFTHVEDVKISEMGGGIGRRAVAQLWRHHRYGRGRGAVPPIARDWPSPLRFEMAESIKPAAEDGDGGAIDSLLLRYVRSRLLGGRTWGAGYYGLPIVAGLEALWMMLAATGWLARLHAGACGRGSLTLADVEAALLRTDRAAGRAPWLGSRGERLRLSWLGESGGVRSLLRAMRLTAETFDDDGDDDNGDVAGAGESPDVAAD